MSDSPQGVAGDAAAGTTPDGFEDTTLILADFQQIRFDGADFNLSASGTTLKVESTAVAGANNYVATFIVKPTSGEVGSTSRHTHTSLADAVAAVTGSSIIYLLEGTHNIPATISYTSNFDLAIVGAGPASILSLANGVNDDVIKMEGGAGQTARIHLANFAIDANKANNATSRGIDIIGAHEFVTLENLIIENANDDGIRFSMQAATKGVTINNCRVRASGANDFALLGAFVGGYKVSNCTSTDAGTNGFDFDGNGQLVNCTANNSTTFGFELNLANAEAMLSNCYAFSCNIGFELSGNNARITANSCQSNLNISHGFRITGSQTILSGCIAQNDTINGFRFNGDGAIINGCTVIGSGEHGIFIQNGVSNAVISDCTLIQPGDSSAGTFSGIFLDNNVDDSSISDIVVEGGTTITKYALEEETAGTGSAGNKYSNIIGRNMATGVLQIQSISTVLTDAAQDMVAITRATTDSTGTTTYNTNVIPSCIQFSFDDNSNAKVASWEGFSNGTDESCIFGDGTAVPERDRINCIKVSDGVNGWTGIVSAIRQTDGTDQFRFTISWTKVGAGLNITGTALVKQGEIF